MVLPRALIHAVLAPRGSAPGSQLCCAVTRGSVLGLVRLQLPVWALLYLLSHLEMLAPPRVTRRSGIKCGYEALRLVSSFMIKLHVLNWASLHPVNFCKISILCTSPG